MDNVDDEESTELEVAIAYSVEENDVDKLRMLLQRHPNPEDVLDENLHRAAGENAVAVMDFLVKEGARLDSLDDSFGHDLLSASAGEGALDAAEWLLSRGLSVDGQPLGNPLASAAFGGEFEMVRYLVEHGAGLNYRQGRAQHTACDSAHLEGHHALGDWLEKQGCPLTVARKEFEHRYPLNPPPAKKGRN